MYKNVLKLLSWTLAIVILFPLLTMSTMAVESDEHVHLYVSDGGEKKYEYLSNTQHTPYTLTAYICECGDLYYTRVNLTPENHFPVLSSRVELGTMVGEDGSMVIIYQYTCRDCKGEFTVQES